MKCACCEREFDKQVSRVMAEGYYKGMNVFVCPKCFSSVERWVRLYGCAFPPYLSIQFVEHGFKLLEALLPELVKSPVLTAEDLLELHVKEPHND